MRRARGNPGKRAYNGAEPIAPGDLPTCPAHINAAGRKEWKRLARVMHEMGVLTTVDRAGFAAYCQCYGRWVEAEAKLKETPLLYKTQSGYVQQSPWLSVANKQLELMGRYMAEFGLTPASRSRVQAIVDGAMGPEAVDRIEIVIVSRDPEGNMVERPLNQPNAPSRPYEEANRITRSDVIYLDEDL